MTRPQPTVEIRVKGHLEAEYWAMWFDGMTVTPRENRETVVRGPVADQAALYGLLAKLRDLALPQLSVNHIEPEQGDSPE